MGNNNSSEIRVAPFAKELVQDHAKVNQLLHLVRCSRINFGVFGNNNVFFTGNDTNEERKGEMPLSPSKEHLKKIVELIYANSEANTFFKDAVEKSTVSEETKKKRLLLANKAFPLKDVYKAIDNNEQWSILEGNSKPDLFIESDRFLLVVEGKLTEPHTTSSTSYLKTRNQMLRHIQGAIEYNRKKHQNKKIIAFYIIPETFSQITEIKDKSRFDEIIEKESVMITDPEYIKEIKSCYYGCTTWEKIEKHFNIKFRAVINSEKKE